MGVIRDSARNQQRCLCSARDPFLADERHDKYVLTQRISIFPYLVHLNDNQRRIILLLSKCSILNMISTALRLHMLKKPSDPLRLKWSVNMSVGFVM